MKKGKKILLYGLAALMALQMPAISASAAQTGEIAQETVEAQQFREVTATSGDFGVNNGLHWEYDTETKTVTVSGEDVPNVTMSYFTDWHCTVSDVFPGTTEIINFENCIITDNMDYFFAGLPFLRDIDFTELKTSNLTSMSGMFFDRGSFITEKMTEIDMSIFDTSRVTDMSSMFFGSKFTQINLDGVDTSNVTNMSFMFAECSELTSLDVSGFDTSKVTSLKRRGSG